MSESEERKKAHEREVFDAALRLARSKGGEARRNVDRLSGEVDSSYEAPDLRVHTADGRLIGIEHFRVDHYVKHDRRIQSAAARFANENEGTRKGLVVSAPPGELTEEMIAAFGDMMSEAIRLGKNACADDIAWSLEASLFGTNGHAKKVNRYRKNLASRCDAATPELAYLIEVHSDLSGLFYFDGNVTRRLKPGELPMLSGFYDLLERASQDVEWIVLAFCGAITDDMVDAAVVDCRHGKFRASLERQGLGKTEYLGLGKDAPKSRQAERGAVTYDTAGEDIHYSVENSSGEIDAAELWDNALHDGARALTLAKAVQAFTATMPVQMVYELLRGRTSALGSTITYSDVARLISAVSADEAITWAEQFAERWGIRRPHSDHSTPQSAEGRTHDQ